MCSDSRTGTAMSRIDLHACPMQYFGIRYIVENEDVSKDVEYVLVSSPRASLLHKHQALVRVDGRLQQRK